MENEQKNGILPPASVQPLRAGDQKLTKTKKLADLLLGVLISITAADILGLLWIFAAYVTDPGSAWSNFWGEYTNYMFLGVNPGGMIPVLLVALLGSFSKSPRKYVFRGMLILPLGALIIFLLAFGACMIMLSQWQQ